MPLSWPEKSKRHLAQTKQRSQRPSQTLAHCCGRYQVLADGSEVKDVQTWLTWARCGVGQRWDGNTCAGQTKRFTFDDAQKLAGNGWRVPTVRELHSLVWCSSGKTRSRVDLMDGKGAIESECDGDFIRDTTHSIAFPKTSSW